MPGSIPKRWARRWRRKRRRLSPSTRRKACPSRRRRRSPARAWRNSARGLVLSTDKSVSPSEKDRVAILAERRNAKMARSAHAYMRGNTVKFYEWLETTSGKSLPAGPPVWICGDCHVGHLGPIANLEGRVDIQIRDLDQTVIGNPAHDLIRLALSLATAARSSDLPGVTTARMIEEMVTGYRSALDGGKARTAPGKDAEPVQRVM